MPTPAISLFFSPRGSTEQVGMQMAEHDLLSIDDTPYREGF